MRPVAVSGVFGGLAADKAVVDVVEVLAFVVVVVEVIVVEVGDSGMVNLTSLKK